MNEKEKVFTLGEVKDLDLLSGAFEQVCQGNKKAIMINQRYKESVSVGDKICFHKINVRGQLLGSSVFVTITCIEEYQKYDGDLLVSFANLGIVK